MNFETIVFYIFSAILLLSALRVVTARSPIHAALALVLAFFTAASIWLLLEAEFLAITLVLVYVGAVTVLFLFVVMTLDIDVAKMREGFWRHLPLALAAGAVMATEMILVLRTRTDTVAPRNLDTHYSNTKELGRLLDVDYVYPFEIAAVLLLTTLITTLVAVAGQNLFSGSGGLPLALDRYWLFSLAATGTVLYYLHLRNRALSPAITEARLQALQARIRPHFLFNSLNAVLSLIRSDPKRAEQTLEDMADLFRVLMADNRQLTTLEKEVALCRQYLNIEQLRLGERLYIAWAIDKMPREALVPPLVLQPLLENAVYHGIEPRTEPGEISINIDRSRDEVHLVIRNPYLGDDKHHGGNKMALDNVGERLKLHFDAEARLDASIHGNTYQVHITLPYTTSE